MSERYKVIDSSVPTFVTITIVGWVDLFIRRPYTNILDDSLDSNEKREQRLRYIHYNPIDAGSVQHEREWVNCSYLAYEEDKPLLNVKVEPLC
ncbi:hypothetical protein K6119_15695 [Paracrocinitomix mangrovi]|uniref:hypothetical protein n=1 Tax=Paracrocinitomix mangrovi TaxID=2862509 RepID=UPI001C8EECD5|nr:hypothetical protein [Paracrocinitomix mangrovi]UKN01173.1 hypothetical protein K6119_15695 [Paracrocinitomix mangrovi]